MSTSVQPISHNDAIQALQDHMPRWRANPAAFVLDVFDTLPDVWQVEALIHLADRPSSVKDLRDAYSEIRRAYYARRAAPGKEGEFARHNYTLAARGRWSSLPWLKSDYKRPFRRVSVASGHGVGKSTLMAWVCLWLHTCYFPLKVGATAPTAHQLEDVLWAEISKWHGAMPKWLQQQFVVGDLRVMLKGAEKRSFTTGRTARREQPEALQGLHEEHTGVLVDECSGIPDVVFESSEGIMTAASTRALLCSNPTRLDGFFHDTHTRLENWYTLTVSGEDNPRVGEEFIQQIMARYGKGSNGYRIRVQGLFPRADDDATIPLYLIEDAIGRNVHPYKDTPVIWGLDPARFGDDRSALSMRQGNVKLGKTLWWTKQDTMQLVGRIVKLYEDSPSHLRPVDIVVDTVGMGAPIYDRLLEVGLPCTPCNVANTASDEDAYNRVYSELWWLCRQWFEQGDVRLPTHEEDETLKDFIRELARPRYKIMSNGKILVEPKSEVKKRVKEKQSPDLAESFVLTFASTRQRIHRVPKKLPYRSINPLAKVAIR